MEAFTERQVEIIEAATKRIDQHGIQNLTIKNLAADMELSEPALYRHFEGKNAILLGLLHYFAEEMKTRLGKVMGQTYASAGEELRALFDSQLRAFTKQPSVISVIFAENIFHFDKTLSAKVGEIMDLMQGHVRRNVEAGQKRGEYGKAIGVGTLATIIIGSMRLVVLKWKLSGHRSNLVKDGRTVLDGILKMVETK